MKYQLKKILAITLTVAMLATLMGGAAVGVAPDVPDGYWGTETVETAKLYDILRGDAGSGNVRPEDNVKRGEFFAMINRAFGFTIESEVIPFDDYDATKWFAGDISIAAAQGYLQGAASGGLLLAGGDNSITRAEAFALLRRVAKLAAGGESTFEDNDSIPAWFVGDVAAMQAAGYVEGSNNLVRANDPIKRIEAAKVIVEVLGLLVNEPTEGAFGEVAGNLTITSADTKITDAVVGGNVYITEGVGDGDVWLTNVEIAGNLIVAGGGANSVYISGGAIEGNIQLSTQPEYLGHSTHIVLDGVVGTVAVDEDAAVTITTTGDTTIENLSVGNGASVIIDGEAIVDDAIIAGGATLEIGGDVVLENLTIAGDGTLAAPAGYDLTDTNLTVGDGATIVVTDDDGVETIYQVVVNDEGDAALYEIDPETGDLADEPTEGVVGDMTVIVPDAEPDPTEPTEPTEPTDPDEGEDEDEDETPYVPPYIPSYPDPVITGVTAGADTYTASAFDYVTDTHTDHVLAVKGLDTIAEVTVDEELGKWVVLTLTTNTAATITSSLAATEVYIEGNTYAFIVDDDGDIEEHTITLTTSAGKTATYNVGFGGTEYRAKIDAATTAIAAVVVTLNALNTNTGVVIENDVAVDTDILAGLFGQVASEAGALMMALTATDPHFKFAADIPANIDTYLDLGADTDYGSPSDGIPALRLQILNDTGEDVTGAVVVKTYHYYFIEKANAVSNSINVTIEHQPTAQETAQAEVAALLPTTRFAKGTAATTDVSTVHKVDSFALPAATVDMLETALGIEKVTADELLIYQSIIAGTQAQNWNALKPELDLVRGNGRTSITPVVEYSMVNGTTKEQKYYTTIGGEPNVALTANSIVLTVAENTISGATKYDSATGAWTLNAGARVIIGGWDTSDVWDTIATPASLDHAAAIRMRKDASGDSVYNYVANGDGEKLGYKTKFDFTSGSTIWTASLLRMYATVGFGTGISNAVAPVTTGSVENYVMLYYNASNAIIGYSHVTVTVVVTPVVPR